MSRTIDLFLDLLYPTRCIVCRRSISPGRPRFCPSCAERVSGSVHMRTAYVSDCVCACSYEGELAEAIRRYKFEGCQAYAYAFSELVAERIYEELWGSFDVMTWAPLAADRMRERGYDQTKLIAEKTAKRLCVPLVPTLKKKNGVKKQSMTKSAAERRLNISGAYSVPKPAPVAGKRILLIDDIVTSGSTISECAKTLRHAGAERVVCAALAKTPAP